MLSSPLTRLIGVFWIVSCLVLGFLAGFDMLILSTMLMFGCAFHADEAMVLHGQVREVDRLGNNAADDAADFGRCRVGNAVIDARRNLFVIAGILFSSIFIGFSLLFLELWSIMMASLGSCCS